MPKKTTLKQLILKASTPKAIISQPKDIRTDIDRIDILARRILTGDILLPKFQRQFVWRKTQILRLRDSIANFD